MVALPDAAGPAASPGFSTADYARQMARTSAAGAAADAAYTGILDRARIYLAGRFGVRIEDIVTVTEDGGRRLDNTGREPRTVH